MPDLWAQGRGLLLARHRGRGLRLARRSPILSPTTLGPSVWAWVKTLTPGKRLVRLDVTCGRDGPYLRIHIRIASGVPVLFCLPLVRTLTGASVHHDVRQAEWSALTARRHLRMTPVTDKAATWRHPC